MLKRVAVEGFQSLASVNVDLNQPIVLFVGESDCGKSAFLRAINNAVFEGVGGSFFRITPKGKRVGQMTAIIESDRGSISWKKTKSISSYTVSTVSGESKEYPDCGREVPADVFKTLGLSSSIDLGESLHYRNQYMLPFLLKDRGPKDSYRFLSTLLGADVAITVLNTVESDVRSLTKDISIVEKAVSDKQVEIDAYYSLEQLDKMDAVLQQMQQVSDISESYKKRKIDLDAVSLKSLALDVSERTLVSFSDFFQRVSDASLKVQDCSVLLAEDSFRLEALTSLKNMVSLYDSCCNRISSLSSLVASLSSVADTISTCSSELQAAVSKKSCLESMGSTALLISKLSDTVDRYGFVLSASVQPLIDVQEAYSSYLLQKQSLSNIQLISERVDSLSKVPPVDADYFIYQFSSISQEYSRLSSQLQAIKAISILFTGCTSAAVKVSCEEADLTAFLSERDLVLDSFKRQFSCAADKCPLYVSLTTAAEI